MLIESSVSANRVEHGLAIASLLHRLIARHSCSFDEAICDAAGGTVTSAVTCHMTAGAMGANSTIDPGDVREVRSSNESEASERIRLKRAHETHAVLKDTVIVSQTVRA